MRFFLHYLRSRRLIFCSFAAALLAFPLIFFLYGLPKQALLYPSALAALIGLCAFTADFLKFRRRHAQLARLLNFQEGMALELPAPADALEADYQALIQLLEAREAERQTQQDRRYQDMCDYYTTWAHQIKTPIAAMRLNLKNEDSPLSRRLLSDLMRVERYAEMVMAYLRVESPSTDYLLRRLCIDDAVKRAVRPFAGEFIARRLKLNYEETGLSAVSDEKWLVFVLEQILSNALKYTPEGGIHIYRSAPNTLTIQDTGIGIAPEDLPRVFEKGYTGLNGRSDLKASGIGLYLSKKVLTKLGHSISAESEPGRGTAIHIDFTQRDVRE